MTINNAVNKLTWRLQNGWNANKNDVEAINTIIEFVNAKHENQFSNNELFAKLYISFYGELLRFYEATPFDKIPSNNLNRILDQPIENLIVKFIDKAQEVEQYLEFKNNGMIKHPLNYTSEQKAKVKIIEKMDYETTKDALVSMINLALDSYK